MASGENYATDAVQHHLAFSPDLSIDDWKAVADIVSSSVTTLAVIAGGVWAYFKFVRGRTFKPRLSVDIAAQWRDHRGRDLLHVRVNVTNLGASRIWLNQYGTGMHVSFPSDSPAEANEIAWLTIPFIDSHHEGEQSDNPPSRAFEIFTAHQWIEPGESISDDLLLDPERPRTITRLDVALLWNTRKRKPGYSRKDIQVDARRVVPIDSTMLDALDKTSS